MASSTTHFVFTTLRSDEQKIFIDSLVSSIVFLEDVKVRKNYSISVVEEILTKKPFTKTFTQSLLEDNTIPRSVFDVAKLAIECLKNLTSEDLWQFYLYNEEQMSEYERKYNNINGSSAENELSKIIYRYANEGRPGGLNLVQQENRKQVRFDEGNYQNGASFDNGSRI